MLSLADGAIRVGRQPLRWSLDDLMVRVREAIEVDLEAVGDDIEPLEFVGVQRITVAA